MNKLSKDKIFCVIFFLIFFVILNFFLLTDVSHVSNSFKNEDKVQHFFAFVLLSFPAMYLLPKKTLLISIVASFYGALIEILQGYLTITHDPSFYDWVADSLGVFFSLLFFKILFRNQLN